MERVEEIQTIIYLGIDDMFGKDYPYLKAGDFQGIANKIYEGELQPVNKADDSTAFLQAVKSQRSTFCSTIMHQDWDTVLRTECESLLIMYDQMAERIQERKAK